MPLDGEPKSGLIGTIRGELEPRKLLPGFTAGTVAGIIQISVCLSFAAMVFSGNLSPSLSICLSAMLAGGVILNIFAAARSSAPGISAAPQDGPAAVSAVLAASIAAAAAAEAGSRGTAVTVLAAVAASTVLTGVFFWAFGVLRVGGLVRFIPYPVIGGFLAGTGWLLFQGSVKVMADVPLDPAHAAGLFNPGTLLKWGPGIGFGFLIFIGKRLSSHYLVLPAMLAAAGAAFYAVVYATGHSAAEAEEAGYLLAGLPSGVLFDPLALSDFGLIDWKAVLFETGNLATLVIVSLVQFLLYISGLEISIKRDLDLDRELRAAGTANIAAGALGSVAGYPWPSTSILAHRMGAKSRLVGIFSAAVFAFCLFSGVPVLQYFPKMLLGGILAYLGLAFLAEWVVEAAFRLPRSDYSIVLLILAVIGSIGFLEGVAVGLVGAVALFVVKYSRIRVIKIALSGSDYRSNRDRAPRHMKILKEKGGGISILKLQGFIFFGTADGLLKEIRNRASHAAAQALRYAVLDFRQVTGLDSSALLSFAKLRQFAEAQDIRIVFAGLRHDFEAQLVKTGFEWKDEGLFHAFPDLDRAMEWCEERILVEAEATFTSDRASLEEFLKDYIPSSDLLGRLKLYFEKENLEAGRTLIIQGQNSRELYYVESGMVTVVLDIPGGKRIRLRTMGAGTVVGETGLYMGSPRTASVITDAPSVVFKLTQDSLRKMETEAPEVAAAFHHFLVRHLAERLIQANQTMQALVE